MATVFSYDQSADVMSRIKTSRNAINEVFADCDKVAQGLQENIQTVGVSGNQDVSQAALNAYNSLKKHYFLIFRIPLYFHPCFFLFEILQFESLSYMQMHFVLFLLQCMELLPLLHLHLQKLLLLLMLLLKEL